MTENDDETVSEQKREKLLERVNRKTATVGQSIPSTVEIDGTDMELKEFVWETKEQGTVPPNLRDTVREVRRKLIQERERRKDQLATAELTEQEAQNLADSIVGIDRAVSALKNLKEPDIRESARESEIESNRRWVNFLNTIQ